MPEEAEYRRLLGKMHEALEPIEALLAALSGSQQATVEIRARAARISEGLCELEKEVDRLWDEFKRLPPRPTRPMTQKKAGTQTSAEEAYRSDRREQFPS